MHAIIRATVLLYAASFLVLALFVSRVPLDVPGSLHNRELAQISGVGVTIGVAPNPDNTLAEALRTREETLAVREAYLAEQEQQRQRSYGSALVFALIGQSVLLILLIVNFFFDYRARHASPLATASGAL